MQIFPLKQKSIRLLLVPATAAVLALAPAHPSFAASSFFGCKSVEVATYPERIHVKCAQPANGNYFYFAIPTANSAHAARILSTLLMGHTVGKNLVVEFDPADTSGTAFGCGANDCRRLLSVAVQ